ncbi:MAG: hypothetical protein ACM3NO_05515 [Deltaproteobacteria bacterium]
MKRSSFSLNSLLILVTVISGAGVLFAQRRASIADGTEIKIRLDKQLDTETAKAGDTFTGTLPEPVTSSGGRTVLFRGASVKGRVVEAVSSGRLKKPASITLELTSVATQPLRIDGKSHNVRNAEYIGGGAAAGALLGALVGGKKGAAIGAGVGAGAGTAGAYMTGKKELVLPAETELTFVAGMAPTGSAGATPTQRTTSSGSAQPVQQSPSYRSGQGDERTSVGRYSSIPEFSSRDQQIIRSYYGGGGGGRGLPPGLAKRHGNLPPGLQRHLEKNGTLPPGLQKRVEPFPDDLDRRLSALPSGYSRVILEGRAMILDRNNKILDLIAVVQ